MPVPDLSFREASAWAMGVLFLLLTAFYLVEADAISWRDGVAPPVTPLAVKVMLAAIVGSIIVHAVLGARRPAEAEAPADERERHVLTRASHWSGLVLGAGCVAALFNYLVHGNGDLLFHSILLALLVSTVAEYAFQALLFRRGA